MNQEPVSCLELSMNEETLPRSERTYWCGRSLYVRQFRRLQCDAVGRCNAIFSHCSLGKPVIHSINRIASRKTFYFAPYIDHNSRELMAGYGMNPGKTFFCVRGWIPLQFCWGDASRMNFDEKLLLPGVRHGQLSRSQLDVAFAI